MYKQKMQFYVDRLFPKTGNPQSNVTIYLVVILLLLGS